jgi:DNA-directed RNA polymerase subunit RPC12/RpoP
MISGELKGRVVNTIKIGDDDRIKTTCIKCSAPLLEFIKSHVSKDDKNNTDWQVRADCPHCGGKSIIHKLHCAKFSLGPVLENGEETPYTLMDQQYVDTDRNGNVVFAFQTTVGKKWGVS